ncbi:MAG: hypothetical protein Q4C45_06325, partial [Oscillospiraceae bacterium]|nr:hypothetical protein [Oscillospiraceae bacterium]
MNEYAKPLIRHLEFITNCAILILKDNLKLSVDLGLENEGEFLSTNALKLELDALMPKRFVDRDELRNTITCSIEMLLKKDNYHEIIAIYGMGGIGKSRFLNEIK